jgi:hypothetical protein
MNFSLSRRIAAEFAGTFLLLAAVVGSGIMGERMAAGNVAIALLAKHVRYRRGFDCNHSLVRSDLRRTLESRRNIGRSMAGRI